MDKITKEEAVERLKSLKKSSESLMEEHKDSEFLNSSFSKNNEALGMAIEALEKMTPKKPNWVYEDEPLCPFCGEIMDEGENPCENCNQLIDWSE